MTKRGMRATSMRDMEIKPKGVSPPAAASMSDADIRHMLGDWQRAADDPFASLSPGAQLSPEVPDHKAAADPVDVLVQLQREAEAALRDPNYVSTHVMRAGASDAPEPTRTDGDPLHALTCADQGEDSLLELLDGPASISGLAEPIESLDAHELFAAPPAPDVLRLFAGDIVPTRRQDVAAPLTRREHHLISMDSTYRPAQAQEPENDN